MTEEPAVSEERVAQARAVQEHLATFEEQHEVAQISEATGIDEADVREVLDAWRPGSQDDDDPVYVGPGGGGPWVISAPQGATYVMNNTGEVTDVTLNGNESEETSNGEEQHQE
jgi:hypothetical protein